MFMQSISLFNSNFDTRSLALRSKSDPGRISPLLTCRHISVSSFISTSQKCYQISPFTRDTISPTHHIHDTPLYHLCHLYLPYFLQMTNQSQCPAWVPPLLLTHPKSLLSMLSLFLASMWILRPENPLYVFSEASVVLSRLINCRYVNVFSTYLKKKDY